MTFFFLETGQHFHHTQLENQTSAKSGKLARFLDSSRGGIITNRSLCAPIEQAFIMQDYPYNLSVGKGRRETPTIRLSS